MQCTLSAYACTNKGRRFRVYPNIRNKAKRESREMKRIKIVNSQPILNATRTPSLCQALILKLRARMQVFNVRINDIITSRKGSRQYVCTPVLYTSCRHRVIADNNHRNIQGFNR